MLNQSQLILEMSDYLANDPRRIHHFLKVLGFAQAISSCEQLDPCTATILETAAIVHDIGSKISEAKYGQSNGKLQEQEGPAEARKVLESLDYPSNIIDRVCYLVAHHHTYNTIAGLDYQVLIEADFLVNAYDHSLSPESIQSFASRYFKTQTGKYLLERLYLKDHRT